MIMMQWLMMYMINNNVMNDSQYYIRMGTLSMQHKHSVLILPHDCMATYSNKDEVSSLVHILKLVTFYHEVLESLTSHSLLEVSEELPDSVSLGSNYVYTIGINEPLLEPSLTLPEEIADSKSNPSWLLCYLIDIFHPINSHSVRSAGLKLHYLQWKPSA